MYKRQVFKVSVVQLVRLDRLVRQVTLDLRVYRALLDQLGSREHQVILERLAQQEQREQQGQILP